MLGFLPIPESVEVPQGELETIAVDHQGRIYCGGQFWQRVQVYDRDGNFLYGWPIDASGGAFRLTADPQGRIHVAAARTQKHLVYATDGTLLSEEDLHELPQDFQSKTDLTDAVGNRYVIRSPHLFPRVIRIDRDGRPHRVVGTRWYLWLVQGPIPAWPIAVVGMLLLAISQNMRRRSGHKRVGIGTK